MYNMIPIVILISSLGGDDFQTREECERVLTKNILNNIKILKASKDGCTDTEIKTRLDRIISRYDYNYSEALMDSYPILPQLDMIIGQTDEFRNYRQAAIEENYKSKYPIYNACRRATYLYLRDKLSTRQVDPKDIDRMVKRAFVVETFWYIWLSSPNNYLFPGWNRPTF